MHRHRILPPLRVPHRRPHCSRNIDVEERPIDAIHRRQLPRTASLTRRALLLITHASFIPHLLHRAPAHLRNRKQPLRPHALPPLRIRRRIPKARRRQRPLRPPPAHAREVPLHNARAAVPIHLLAHVDEALHARHVQVRDGAEVEDDRAQHRARVLREIDDLPAPRARVVPRPVAEALVEVELGGAREREDGGRERVEVGGLVGVGEAVGRLEDDDARVGHRGEGGARVGAVDVREREVGVDGGGRGARLGGGGGRSAGAGDVGGGGGRAGARGRVGLGGAVAREFGVGEVVDADAAEDEAFGAGVAEEQDGGGGGDGGVDAVFDVGEDGDEDAGEENDDFQRGDLVETVDDIGRRDEITHGVNDQPGQTG